MTASAAISIEINGEHVDADVLPRVSLADFLREHLNLTGTHVGCEHGVCGACTIRVNGEIVRACLMLAVQAHGRSVQTIEGLSDSGDVTDLQAAFRDHNALQCGYCTPGVLMAAQDLLAQPLLYHSSYADNWALWAEAAGARLPADWRGTGFDLVLNLIEAARAGMGVAVVQKCMVEADLAARRLAMPVAGVASTGRGYYLCRRRALGAHPAAERFSQWVLAQAALSEPASPARRPATG